MALSLLPFGLAHGEASRDGGELDIDAFFTAALRDERDALFVLENGVVLDGEEYSTPDGATSGFRFQAGYALPRLPALDIGAEIAYMVTDEMPPALSGQPSLLSTTTLNGALTAGVRLGQLTLFAKSGLADWSGQPGTHLGQERARLEGTSQMYGLGARLRLGDNVTGHLDYERIDAPMLAHLNLTTARLSYHF